jgi:hypothetical protein
MKKLVLLFVLLVFGFELYSQGNSCLQATPFCESVGGSGVTFPNNTNTTAPTTGPSGSSPQYGCLTSQPNPTYFFIKTTAAGTMDFNISQVNGAGTGIDVDFVAWGPFANYSTMCSNLTGSCGGLFTVTCSGNIEDCSFSASATDSSLI